MILLNILAVNSKLQNQPNYQFTGLKKEKNMATKRDREILNAVVNPLLPLGEAVFDDDDIVPEDLKDIEEKVDTKTYR